MDKTRKHFKLLTPAKTGSFIDSVLAARSENGQHHTSHLLNERVAYSLLAYRARCQSGATANEIARETTLHKQTVAKTLINLPYLVHQHDGKWFANEPPEGWFSSWNNSKAAHWSDRIAYIMFHVPAKGARTKNGRRFGLAHAAVYSIILSYTKKETTTTALSINFVSTLLNGMNRKTISAALDDLKELSMVKCEQRSSRLEIKRLQLSEEHLKLFERQPEKHNNINSKPEQYDLPASNKYEYKQDRFDKYRKLCDGLMPQAYCERAIRAAQFLGISIDDFGANLRDQKRKSDENVRSGKCTVENLGKFFVTPMEQRVKACEEARRREEAEERAFQRMDSPEYRKAQKEYDEAVAANPLNEEQFITWESLVSRIKFSDVFGENIKMAERYKRKLLQHCRGSACDQCGTLDKADSVYNNIIRLALSKVNHYYQQEVLATTEEFEMAVDTAITELQPGLEPMFDTKATATEVTHG